MHNFSIMIYTVANIINTNVILRNNMPFFQNFKLFIIIFECNGFMQCQPMFIHANWVYSVGPNIFYHETIFVQNSNGLTNIYTTTSLFLTTRIPKHVIIAFVEVTIFPNTIIKTNCNCITLNLSNPSLFAFLTFKFKGLLGFNVIAYFSM